jgi:hypothetical protein
MMPAFAGALAVLVKPTAGFLLVPFCIFCAVVTVFSLCLFAYWLIRLFVITFMVVEYDSAVPEGIPYLIGSIKEISGSRARFQWLFAKRLAELMLGYWGLIPFGRVLVRSVKDGCFPL